MLKRAGSGYLQRLFQIELFGFFLQDISSYRQPKLAIPALRSTLPVRGLYVKPNDISKNKITLSYFFVKKTNFFYIATFDTLSPTLNIICNCNVYTRSNWIYSPKSLYCIIKLVFYWPLLYHFSYTTLVSSVMTFETDGQWATKWELWLTKRPKVFGSQQLAKRRTFFFLHSQES